MKKVIACSAIFAFLNAVILWVMAVLWLVGYRFSFLCSPNCFAVSALWSFIVMAGWGPLVDAINWRVFRREREAEIRAQTAIIDAHIQMLEERGFSRREAERLVELKQRAWWYDKLTPQELAEWNAIISQKTTMRRAAE